MSSIVRSSLVPLRVLAAKKGCTANQVALAWLLHQPFPTFPIIGSRSPQHIRESMEAIGKAEG